jgi:hypothetical protein
MDISNIYEYKLQISNCKTDGVTNKKASLASALGER